MNIILGKLRKIFSRDFLAYGIAILRSLLGMDNRLATPDRIFLEDVVMPFYARQKDIKRVLFIGTEWYTRHYELIFQGKEYWTIDIKPWKRLFSGKMHRTAAVEDLRKHFEAGYFDLIICNGVYGWGLNRKDHCELAFEQCFECLSDGGHFLLGWNDRPEFNPGPIDAIENLSLFKPFVFPETGASRHNANEENGHTFNFYQKRAGV